MLKKILLVEDSREDIELILSALSDNNLANEVVAVRDGEEALDYLYRRRLFMMRFPGDPIVILLDNKLPKLNGLEVLREIKTHAHLKLIPVVMLTSSREEPDLEHAYRLGANAYVVKPVDFGEFMQTVKKLGLFWAVVNQPPVWELALRDPGDHA